MTEGLLLIDRDSIVDEGGGDEREGRMLCLIVGTYEGGSLIAMVGTGVRKYEDGKLLISIEGLSDFCTFGKNVGEKVGLPLIKIEGDSETIFVGPLLFSVLGEAVGYMEGCVDFWVGILLILVGAEEGPIV